MDSPLCSARSCGLATTTLDSWLCALSSAIEQVLNRTFFTPMFEKGGYNTVTDGVLRVPCVPCLREKLRDPKHRCRNRYSDRGRRQKTCDHCFHSRRKCVRVSSSFLFVFPDLGRLRLFLWVLADLGRSRRASTGSFVPRFASPLLSKRGSCPLR